MTTSNRFRPTLWLSAAPRVRTCDGQASLTFKAVADRLLASARESATARFAAWERTTFAERSVTAARAAAALRARPVTIWTLAESSSASLRPSAYKRLLSCLMTLGFVNKKTAPAAPNPAVA